MCTKKFITFLAGLILCFWHSLIIAMMPGVDLSSIPGFPQPAPVVPEVPVVQQVSVPQPAAPTPQAPVPLAGRVAGPAVGGARPQVMGVPGQIAFAAPIAAAPTQYGSEADILKALTDAASPGTPLFNENQGAKSKIVVYKVILKSLSALFPNITLDTKYKILDGFYTDVLNSAADTTTYLVSNSALDEIYTKILGNPSKTGASDDKCTSFFLLNQVQNELRKSTSPSVSKYTQMFNKIYTNLLAGRSKMESQIKKQTDFSNELDAVRAIDLDRIANKIDAYKRLISNVNKSITITSRNDLITEIGRLIGLVGDESTRQSVLTLFKFIQANQFFTAAEKSSLAGFEKAKTAAVTPTPTPTKGLSVLGQPALPTKPTAPGVAQPTPSAPAPTPAIAQAKKIVVSIDVLNKKFTATQKNYPELLKICSTVVNLFPTITDPNNKKALVPLLIDKFTVLYSNRGILKNDDLATLTAMFEKAKSIGELANAITPERLNSLRLISQLSAASVEKVFSKKIADYVQIANSIDPSVHNFEKGRFIDGITNLFSLRKKPDKDDKRTITGAEADALKNLLNSLNSSPFKDKNIFDSTMQKTLGTWIKIIEATSILFSQIELKPAKEQIALLKTILDKVTVPNAEYEKKQLVLVTIPGLYNSRGNLMQEDLLSMKDLFTNIQNTAGLLASNQISTIVAWINELDSAAKITTGQKIYISALLDSATNGKDLSAYEKIASLFTPQTPVPVMAAFVGALNSIFKARDTYDKKKVLNLFQIINQKKLSNGTNLLGPAQKAVMVQWIKILTNETKPVQPATTARAR